MRPDIHPKYYPEARIVCACGKAWTTGATQPEIRVDVCFNCHPFYTGEQRIVDTAGRVDRFRMRLAQKREERAPKKVRGQRVLVVNPDEQAADAAAAALASAPVAASGSAPAAASEPAAEIEMGDELRVRTVLEDESGAVVVSGDDDDAPRRRPAARKPRAAAARKPAKAEGEPAAGSEGASA
ncbi:MAG: 50S ribosomal protein L31 [Chloroflexi bacterium]|nr:50S ribosomal protein L31 [Chloroflexota bacterium]